LPVDWRVGVRWRASDGQSELLASQRGGLAASPLDPPALNGEDLDAAEGPAAEVVDWPGRGIALPNLLPYFTER
jgi:hypothetical protein